MHKISKDPAHQAFQILQMTFVFFPILGGIDKFFNLLTDWSQYLSPFASKILQHHDREFMLFVGVVEIVAGIGVFLKPRIFAYIVSLWIFAIIINLFLTGSFFDIALRDLGLCLCALSLGRLSQKYAK